MIAKQNLPKIIFGAVVGLLLILLPFYAGQYTVTTFTRIIYFGFLALSVGFLIGQGGMVSLTHTAFFGIAGYVIGLVGYEMGVPFPLADLLAVVIALVFALIFGMIAVRTYQIVFLMITLAFGQVVWAFALQNTKLLNGWAGFVGIRPFVIMGINFTKTENYYWVSLLLFAIGLYVLWRLVNSPFGLALNGTRESPKRMAALGYPVYWIRVVAFLIAAVYAAIGGILATYSTGVITPTTIQLSRTIYVLLMVILGGASYFWGPVIGTFIAIWLDVLISQNTERYNTVIGIIFVLTVLFSPTGILGLIDSVRRGRKMPWILKLFNKKIVPPEKSGAE